MFLIFKGGYEQTQLGSPCDGEQYEIKSEDECQRAGTNLGFPFFQGWNGPNDFPACFYADDGRNLVFYNRSPNPKRTDFNPQYSAICMKKGRKCSLVLIL